MDTIHVASCILEGIFEAVHACRGTSDADVRSLLRNKRTDGKTFLHLKQERAPFGTRFDNPCTDVLKLIRQTDFGGVDDVLLYFKIG